MYVAFWNHGNPQVMNDAYICECNIISWDMKIALMLIHVHLIAQELKRQMRNKNKGNEVSPNRGMYSEVSSLMHAV